MGGRFTDRPVGHLELKKTGYWYIVARSQDGFKAVNTRAKDRAEAQKALDAFLSAERRRLEERIAAIPLAKVWKQYETSPNAYRHEEKARRKKRGAWLAMAKWMQDAHPEVDDASKVTVAMANEYMNRYREGHTASTCNNKLKFFSGMFDALLRDGLVGSNPWRAVRRFESDGRTRRELTTAEVGRILAAAAKAGGEWHSLMMVGLYTGLRLGDCCTLDWNSVDLAHMIFQLIPRKTKKYSCGRLVTIPIHPQLLGILERTPADERTGCVLREMADLYLSHNSTLGARIRGIFNAAGIETSVMVEGRAWPTPYATFHSLRHSFVSFATNSGVPLAVVQSIVGHHSSAMTRHYYHVNEEALRRAVDAVPDFEEKLGGGATVRPPLAQPPTVEVSQPAVAATPRPAATVAPCGLRGAPPPPPVQKPPMPPQPLVAPPAAAPRPAPAAAAQGAQRPARSLVERMKEASELYKEGMITEDEFNALRRQILATA